MGDGFCIVLIHYSTVQIITHIWEQSLEAWREHHVTRHLLGLMAKQAQLAKKSALEAYWAGSPYSEAELSEFKGKEILLDDLRTSTADDWNAWEETLNES